MLPHTTNMLDDTAHTLDCSPHLEFQMDLYQPVNENCPHLIIDVSLQVTRTVSGWLLKERSTISRPDLHLPDPSYSPVPS